MIRMIALFALLAAFPAQADDARELAPTGTLRATFIGRNPVQATIDATTGEARGPAAELARMMAGKFGVPLAISGVANGPAVIESVTSGAAGESPAASATVRSGRLSPPAALSAAEPTGA